MPTPMSSIRRIDTHAHFVPPEWRRICEETGFEHPDGMPAIPEWSEQAHVEMMDYFNISKAILSVTSPGTHLIPGDRALARKVTRECNDFAAGLKRRRRDRFGFWASLPLPDVEGSIEELHRALDHLNADGVSLLTNHHGKYLGDPSFDHLFYELNARKVTVFIHPTAPCRVLDYGLQTAVPLCQHPYPVYEFIFEDARGIMNLFLSGTVEKYPDITYVISHAGGAFAPLIERFSTLPGLIDMDVPQSLNSASVRETLSQQFYFDLAGFPFPDQIYGLLPWLSKKKLIYGSDFPYTPLSGVAEIVESIDEGLPEVYPDASDRDAIYYRNAEELLSKGPVNTGLDLVLDETVLKSTFSNEVIRLKIFGPIDDRLSVIYVPCTFGRSNLGVKGRAHGPELHEEPQFSW